MMSKLKPIELLLVKQTCRLFAYKFEMASNQSTQESTNNIYSLEFLKCLYDSPVENLNKILETHLIDNESENGETPTIDEDEDEDQDGTIYCLAEKKVLLDYFKNVVEMKSKPAKQWTDLQHYLCFVYRYCMTNEPDMEQEILSPYFICHMRTLACSLMEEDQIQLCLRLFSLIREYTVFAQKQHQKIDSIELSIESLFYYYEAFLSATKNICKIFPELEKLLLNTYKLGWLDFNTSIFMYYFYETPYVQGLVHTFEQMKDNVSIKAAGIYTVLTELRKLWRSQMLGINSVIANKLGAKFKGLDNNMLSAHKRILSKGFWIDRTPEEKAMQDLQLFDCQLFTLVGNKSLVMPDITLEESGECICEDCLIIHYTAICENKLEKLVLEDGGMKVSCGFCKQKVNLDQFQQHINERAFAQFDGDCCKISNQLDNARKLNVVLKPNPIHNKSYINGDVVKVPSPKLANEPPSFNNTDFENGGNDSIKTSPDAEITKLTRKTFYNFLKSRNSIIRTDDNQAEQSSKPVEKPLTAQSQANHTAKNRWVPKSDEFKVEVKKISKGTNTSNKNTGMVFPGGHSCKLEEELKSEFKKAYQDTCDHHKESKKCECTFCEVFGTTNAHAHKTNETRNRLRIRLNQRNENVSSVLSKDNVRSNLNHTIKSNGNKNESPGTVSSKLSHSPVSSESNTNSLMNDIHGLLNFIEGNTNVDKLALAEKKAAKKARQRHKKEQERLKAEEEERKRIDEEKRIAKERLRNEELAKQLADKTAKNSKKKKQSKNKECSVNKLVEETIPAMVTIKRVIENDSSLPTVTITLKGSTPDQDKLLYTLVNGYDGNNAQFDETKKNKKNKQETFTKTVNLEVNTSSSKTKKKNKNDQIQTNTVTTKELRVTLAVDPVSANYTKKKNKQANKPSDTNSNSKEVENKKDKSKDPNINIPMLKLPPGITITKVDGPMTDRNYKASNIDNPPYNTNIPVSKSGVIVVDTEKLIKQSTTTSEVTTTSKKCRRKRNKKQRESQSETLTVQTNKPSMVTLKNPIFQNMQNTRRESADMMPDLSGNQCQQASIFKNENGMVTIRSSRLQQSLNSGTPITNLLPDLKPVLGPEVPTTYMSSCNFSEFSRISPFNAQEILSGLPGIEITKVDKNAVKNDLDYKKSCHTAEVSIIPSNNTEKFIFDKDDLHYDNVFTPKDILEDDMDADERELEAFKRFCQQSVPPKRKEKVAHLNVKDIVLKKKNDKISA